MAQENLNMRSKPNMSLHLKSTFFFCMVMLMFPYVSSATTYYFSMTGDDRNPGTSVALPKKSLSAASSLALPGNTLLFKRGDVWYSPFETFDLRNKSGNKDNRITIAAYGEGAKPVIAALQLLDNAQWKNIPGTSTWTQEVTGYSAAFRLFINGRSKYRVNTSDSSAVETAVDSLHEWYIKPVQPGKSAVIFVNTGAPDVKPANVEVLVSTSPFVVTMENSHYITMQNIDFRGGSTWSVIHIEAPSSNLVFDSCVIQRGNGSGIFAENSAQGDLKPYVSNLDITNCLIDKVWSKEENDPAIYLSGDGIFLRHAVDGGLISGNRILNWGHSGISITSYALGVHGVHRLVVELNDVSAGESGYMHAIDMNGFDGLTTHNVIRRNYFHDYNVTGHILGSYNQIYSNIFAGVNITRMPRHSHQGWAVDWHTWRYRRTGPWIEAHDNYLINNTFADAEEFSIMIGDELTNPDPVRNNIIANNIITGYGQLGVVVSDGVQGSVYISHNNFWNGSPSAPVARYKTPGKGGYLDASTLNSKHPEYCRGNIQLDPRFKDVRTRNFRLTRQSPKVIRSGGTNTYYNLLGSDFIDYEGKKFRKNRPSMGAIQYR